MSNAYDDGLVNKIGWHFPLGLPGEKRVSLVPGKHFLQYNHSSFKGGIKFMILVLIAGVCWRMSFLATLLGPQEEGQTVGQASDTETFHVEGGIIGPLGWLRGAF